MANLINFLILIVFFWGRHLRFTNRRLHIRLMTIAMICDYLLVVGLVVFRNALGKLAVDMHWTLKIHVPIAVATLVLYAFAARYGYLLSHGDESARKRLRLSDRLLVPLRVLTLVTSLMVQFLRP